MITNYKVSNYGSAGRFVTFTYQGKEYRLHRNGHISVEYQRAGYYCRYWVRRTIEETSKTGRAIRTALNAVIETA